MDRDIVERVVSEILERPATIEWSHIAGLEHAKAAVQELAVWPLLKPELFRGARPVPRGLLLFGPPGTGKTLIGRAVASQCGATFFSISASSLTSKWIGEGEKMVRALFAVRRDVRTRGDFRRRDRLAAQRAQIRRRARVLATHEDGIFGADGRTRRRRGGGGGFCSSERRTDRRNWTTARGGASRNSCTFPCRARRRDAPSSRTSSARIRA